MGLEVRFTPIGIENELTFTIVQEDEDLFLFSTNENIIYKYLLRNDNGLLFLIESNPFIESTDLVEERLEGLSQEWIEQRASGMESSGDTGDHPQNSQPGYGPDDIFVENKPFSLKQIFELIREGDIELSPDFQRNFVWDKTRQSKLIESILLGLPLPSIYLSQYEDGRLTVVDGLQRLTTLQLFLDDNLVLSNLEYLTHCNGKKFSQLPNVLSPLRIRRFGQTQIMCFVIDYRSPSQLKFDLFRRLNTGGKPLNNQEIRNSLSKPIVQRALKQMVDSEIFRNATGNSIKDKRMDARDAALRFMYFYEQYSLNENIGEYNGDMENTLDNYIDKINRYTEESVIRFLPKFHRGLNNTYHLFGDINFRKMASPRDRKTPINKLMMLTLTILLSEYDRDLIHSKSFGCLKEEICSYIFDNATLYDALTFSTNAKYNISTAFVYFNRFLNENIINNNE